MSDADICEDLLNSYRHFDGHNIIPDALRLYAKRSFFGLRFKYIHLHAGGDVGVPLFATIVADIVSRGYEKPC